MAAVATISAATMTATSINIEGSDGIVHGDAAIRTAPPSSDLQSGESLHQQSPSPMVSAKIQDDIVSGHANNNGSSIEPSSLVEDMDGNDINNCNNTEEPVTTNASSPAPSTATAKEEHSLKPKPVSLAQAADVAQVHVSDSAPSQSHALGGAVAQRLQSLLSHIPKHDHVTKLKSELDSPARVSSNGSAAESSTKNGDGSSAVKPIAVNDIGNSIPGQNDHVKQQLDSSQPETEQQPQHKEFVLKRMFHAFDNYLHPPSKLLSHVHLAPPRHHQQGHRLNSMGPSNHDACTLNFNCGVPNCSQVHSSYNGNQQQQPNIYGVESSRTNQQQNTNASTANDASSRGIHLMNTLSNTVHSMSSTVHHYASSKQSATIAATEEPKTSSAKRSRSFFHLPFHSSGSKQQHQPAKNVRNSRLYKGPLLYNCSDHEEHEAIVTTAAHVCNLYLMGHDVTRSVHRQNGSSRANSSDAASGSESELNSCQVTDHETHENNKQGGESKKAKRFERRARHALSSLGFEFRLDVCQSCGENNIHEESSKCVSAESKCSSWHRCTDCVTRLYHIPSETPVDNDNRKSYIADGKMYDAVANLCQAAAQEIMAEACDLVWVTICDGKGGGLRLQSEREQTSSQSTPRPNSIEEWPRDKDGNIIMKDPIKALVSKNIETDATQSHDTFLVATGKGKVRAGIFSRHHLMTTGLEPSTALPFLYEARERGMNCVVIDPNARGDREGMDTFEVSIRGLFEEQFELVDEEDNDESSTECDMGAIIPANDVDGSIYVLAHSAAGGQLVRYLLDQQEGAPLLSRIHCIAFTDSTHSIQWLKNHPHLSSLLQSSKALYVRSANPMRDDDWGCAGEECPRDRFWSHRFGDIKTVWAGTTEHSLSNWTAHKPIWEHVDRVREEEGRKSESVGADQDSNHDKETNGKIAAANNRTARDKSPCKVHRSIGTTPVVV